MQNHGMESQHRRLRGRVQQRLGENRLKLVWPPSSKQLLRDIDATVLEYWISLGPAGVDLDSAHDLPDQDQ